MKENEKTISTIHQSVLLRETVEIISVIKKGVIVDCTLGMGGHSEYLLENFPKLKIIGIDQDEDALAIAIKRLEKFGKRFISFHANFSELGEVLADAGIEKVNGVIADLGVSSMQLDSETRGFSFRFDAPLDMRMDPNSGEETAADLLETLSEFEIAKIIYEYGEEKFSRRIARRIIERRAIGKTPSTTKELADLVWQAVPRSKKDKIHPATKTFQALRIAVNHELEILEKFIDVAIEKLNDNGRLAVISFHSLEDRIVKRTMQKLSGKCECSPKLPVCLCRAEKKVEILTRKPIVPKETELERNPRARSAKLRACRRIT